MEKPQGYRIRKNGGLQDIIVTRCDGEVSWRTVHEHYMEEFAKTADEITSWSSMRTYLTTQEEALLQKKIDDMAIIRNKLRVEMEIAASVRTPGNIIGGLTLT